MEIAQISHFHSLESLTSRLIALTVAAEEQMGDCIRGDQNLCSRNQSLRTGRAESFYRFESLQVQIKTLE